MYVDIVPNRKSPPAILLREGWREGKKVRKRTITNLSDWPAEKIEALRRLLKGERLVPVGEAFAIERSLPHGHVAALLAMARKIGLEHLIATKPSRTRDLVLAMIVERLVQPVSKLATTRLWHTTTLAQELGVEDAAQGFPDRCGRGIGCCHSGNRRSWPMVNEPCSQERRPDL